MKTMRRRMIEYMQIKKGVSASELARAFKISAAGARHHLARLEEDGVVYIVETRIKGRGRPTQVYGLTSELNRTNLDSLANAILGEWLDDLPVEKKDAALERIASHLLEGKNVPEGNLTQRIARTVRQLTGMNYQVRWEAHVNAPLIMVTHCPYASVVSRHPEICRMDEYLLEKLLGFPVKLISKPGNNEFGESQCVFRLAIPHME
jgi:predicted ArsR family transcriptional regulator